MSAQFKGPYHPKLILAINAAKRDGVEIIHNDNGTVDFGDEDWFWQYFSDVENKRRSPFTVVGADQ